MTSEDTPRTWSAMSFEFKGMFAYHAAMMAMMFAGGRLAFIEEIAIAGAIALLVVLASIIRRLRRKWHWQGLTPFHAAGAVLMTALAGYFLFAIAGGSFLGQGMTLDRPFALGPWVLAGVGLAAFAILNFLRITHLTEKAFLEECGDQALQPRPAPPPEPRWKMIAKATFIIAFFAVWLAIITSFYLTDRAFRTGTPSPTVERTVPMTNHGTTVYVTADDKRLIDQLQTFAFAGIPVIIVLAFFMQVVLKVRFNALR